MVNVAELKICPSLIFVAPNFYSFFTSWFIQDVFYTYVSNMFPSSFFPVRIINFWNRCSFVKIIFTCINTRYTEFKWKVQCFLLWVSCKLDFYTNFSCIFTLFYILLCNWLLLCWSHTFFTANYLNALKRILLCFFSIFIPKFM